MTALPILVARDRDAFTALADAALADSFVWGILADWLEERDDADGAEAARWLWAKGRRPYLTESGRTEKCGWFSYSLDWDDKDCSEIPFSLGELMGWEKRAGFRAVEKASPVEAVAYLLDAWRRAGAAERAAWWAWEPPS